MAYACVLVDSGVELNQHIGFMRNTMLSDIGLRSNVIYCVILTHERPCITMCKLLYKERVNKDVLQFSFGNRVVDQ